VNTFVPENTLPIEIFNQLSKIKIEHPQLVFEIAKLRKKPEPLGSNGNVLIVAADHNGRMITAYRDDKIGLGNRYLYLARLCRILTKEAVDGIEGTPDIIEDLLLLNHLFKKNGNEEFLNNVNLIGTVNRGGLLKTAWELDDRPLSFTIKGINRLMLDGIKVMFRIKDDDLQSGKTLKYCAEVINEASYNNIPVFIEGLYLKNKKKSYEIDYDTEALVKAVGVSLALGTSAVRKWLEVPFTSDLSRVGLASSGPMIMIQDEKESDPKKIVKEYCQGFSEVPNVYGTLLGRNILFAEQDPLLLAEVIASIWKDGLDIDLAIKKHFNN